MKSSVLRGANKFSCCCFTCLTFLTSKRFLFVAELEVEGCLEVSKSIFSGAAAMFVLFPLPECQGRPGGWGEHRKRSLQQHIHEVLVVKERREEDSIYYYQKLLSKENVASLQKKFAGFC